VNPEDTAHEGHPHHLAIPASLQGPGHGSGKPGDATTEQLMAQAIGGWRGLIDSSVPGAVFVVAYLVDSHQLTPAIWAAVASGAVIAVLRLLRRQPLRQVLSGFVGIAFAAWLASRTGKAEDFYLPGLFISGAYAVVLAISCVVGHPVLGYAVGAATGDMSGWRKVPEQRRAYSLATWIFVGQYTLKIVVLVPLYLAGEVAGLGFMKLILGWPVLALAAWLSYRIIRKARAEAPAPVPPEGHPPALSD